MRVVIADDSILTLDWLVEMLGHSAQIEVVGKCDNGTETLDALRRLKPDMAIVDYRMPGLNGIEVLREIRKTDKTLKFILLTFFAYDKYRQIAMETGADYFFSKIDDYESLSVVIDQMAQEEKSNNIHLV